MWAKRSIKKKNARFQSLKYHYKKHLLLENCLIEELKEDEKIELNLPKNSENYFKIIEKKLSKKWVWKTFNLQEKKQWIHFIKYNN